MSQAPDHHSPHSTSQPPTDRLGRSAGVAGVATLTSRVLGLARDTVMAAVFGAGNDMDAFVVAFRIPNLVRELFAEGAMSAAFVPTFTRYLTLRGKSSAWQLGNNVLNALVVVTGVLVMIGMIAARPLVMAYAGDYAAIPGKIALTIRLTLIMLPFLTLVAIAAAVMGMLNSLRHYFIPALAPAAFNVATIVCAVALTPLLVSFGLPGVMSLAIGAILGGLGQIAVQWPSLRREGFHYSPVLDPRDPALREVVMLMGPGVLGLAATQINLLVSTQLAVSQGTGAVSWLQYAFRLMNLPMGLFGASLATAVLPAVARHAAVDDHTSVTNTITTGIALMLMVNVPASVGLFVLATPIVQLLLERGHFMHADTVATAAAVQCYAVGLVGYSTARIATPVFYALQQSRLAVVLSAVSVATNLVLSVVLVRWIGFRGLALATSLAATTHGVLSLTLLRRTLGRVGGTHLVTTFSKIAIASAAMAVVIVFIANQTNTWVSGTGVVSHAVQLFLPIAAGLLTVAATAKALHVAEFDALLDQVRNRRRT